MNDKNMIHVDHPDDERFDAIDIKVVERWKESDVSGDEWRFSYVAEVKRKGETIISIGTSRLSWLLEGLQWRITTAGEHEQFDREAWERTKDKCDQPGCALEPIVFYTLLKRYTKGGDELAPNSYYDGFVYRQFCERHRRRGDCALDDADHNYDEILDPRVPVT